MTSFAAINSVDPPPQRNWTETTLPKLKGPVSRWTTNGRRRDLFQSRRRGLSSCELAGQRRLFHELFVADETDALHAIALGDRQHLGHSVVVRTPLGPHVQLGLRVTRGFRAEVTFQLIDLHHVAVPDHRAIPIDVDADRLHADL